MKINWGKKKNDMDDGYWGGEDVYGNGDLGDQAEGGWGDMPSEDAEAATAMPGDNRGSSNGGIEMKICTPTGVEDGEEIASMLAAGKTILLNMESIERDDVVRLMDFLRGATYMVDGSITRVSRTSIVVSPKQVDISVIEAMAGDQ